MPTRINFNLQIVGKKKSQGSSVLAAVAKAKTLKVEGGETSTHKMENEEVLTYSSCMFYSMVKDNVTIDKLNKSMGEFVELAFGSAKTKGDITAVTVTYSKSKHESREPK
jgi:hypothetical protein